MKIGLIGTAFSHKKAPFNDPSWELWACNSCVPPRWDRWFQLHGEGVIAQLPGHREWLASQTKPVYLQQYSASIPNGLAYPLAAMKAKYGDWFFTSTISFMLALAIEHEPEEVGLWGVDLAHCMPPETKVLTADLRWVCLGDVSVGDKLIGFDETSSEGRPRKWRAATVQQANDLLKPCYKIYLADGSELISSSDHMWLTVNNADKRWKKTIELITRHNRPGRPTRIQKLFDPWTTETSWEAGYLAAAFDGEGHLSQSSRCEGRGSSVLLGYAQRKNEMSARFMDCAQRLGISIGGGYQSADGGRDCFQYHVSGGRTKVMEALGKVRPPRLLPKFDPDKLGAVYTNNSVAVDRVEYLGMRHVIGIKTSTRTFVAEGFASHNSSEYAYQKPGCRFFLQVARLKGIKVTVPAESEVIAPGRVYGYDPEPWLRMKAGARLQELQHRVAENDGRRQAVWLEKAMLRGLLDLKLTPEDAAARLAQLAAQEAEIERNALLLDGAVQNMSHIVINWCGD